jgi:hypothetical protein
MRRAAALSGESHGARDDLGNVRNKGLPDMDGVILAVGALAYLVLAALIFARYRGEEGIEQGPDETRL